MVVILPGFGVELPGVAIEAGAPIVGRAAVLAVAPDIPIALGIVEAGAGFDEPGVQVRGVVEYQVEDHAHAARVGGVEEGLEIVQCAVFGSHAGVIADVVAAVKLG